MFAQLPSSVVRLPGKRWSRVGLLPLASMLVPLLWYVAAASAQGPAAPPASKGPPSPEEIILPTEDGLLLSVTYFGGTRGKETVPVVLLHSFKGSGNDFRELAKYLQSQGHAVIVPDLRGHGKSTVLKPGIPATAFRPAIKPTFLYADPSRADEDERGSLKPMTPVQFHQMIPGDMEAIKRFLWKKNNAEELNLNKLCIVGTELGASVAVEFAVYDWKAQPRIALQLGKFVKGLVLISPKWSFQGLQMKAAVGNPEVLNMAVMILVGAENRSALDEANRVYKVFLTTERMMLPREKPKDSGEGGTHPAPGKSKSVLSKDLETPKGKQTLFFGKLQTNAQGMELLDAKELNVANHIRAFIDFRLVKSDEAKSDEWQWKQLKYPQ